MLFCNYIFVKGDLQAHVRLRRSFTPMLRAGGRAIVSVRHNDSLLVFYFYLNVCVFLKLVLRVDCSY